MIHFLIVLKWDLASTNGITLVIWHIYNVITTIIKEWHISFSWEDLSNLRLVSKDFANIIPKVLCWLRINFTLLREPHLGYEGQECIDPHHIEMASAAMIYFSLDPGKFVRFLSEEFTVKYRDVQCTLDAVRYHVTLDDYNYNHIKQFFLGSCPG